MLTQLTFTTPPQGDHTIVALKSDGFAIFPPGRIPDYRGLHELEAIRVLSTLGIRDERTSELLKALTLSR